MKNIYLTWLVWGLNVSKDKCAVPNVINIKRIPSKEPARIAKRVRNSFRPFFSLRRRKERVNKVSA